MIKSFRKMHKLPLTNKSSEFTIMIFQNTESIGSLNIQCFGIIVVFFVKAKKTSYSF